MRIPVIATIAGFLAVAALAAPMLPNGPIPDKAFVLADEAVPEMMQASAELADNVLRVATFQKPKPQQPIDFDNLIRINGGDYEVSYSENFSDKVQSLTTVRKIGFGKLEEVSIVTTPSGTYSTDGLASSHVRYPDIATNPAPANGPGLSGAVWHYGQGWLPQQFSPAHSIIVYGRTQSGGRFLAGKGKTCFKSASYYTCS